MSAESPDDLALATNFTLSNIARKAFQLGLVDGEGHGKPRTAAAVAAELELGPRRLMHTRKYRQVYGAGFDVGRMNRSFDMLRGMAQVRT